jgi:hypothetical protein
MEFTINVRPGKSYVLELQYTANHAGANPVWLTFENGQTFYKAFTTREGFNQTWSMNIDATLIEILEERKDFCFDASESYDPDGDIVAYHWDFGDGENASGQVVYHKYQEPGIYMVTLTVFDNNSASNSTTIEVDPPLEQPPQNIKITNLGGQSAAISWVTESESIGYVMWGIDPNNLEFRAYDDFDSNSTNHHCTITGLTPETMYYYRIVSVNSVYETMSFTTLSALATIPEVKTIYGQVMRDSTPLEGALIYVAVSNGQTSLEISTQTDSAGYFLLDLGNLRNASGDMFMALPGDDIIIRIQHGLDYMQYAGVVGADSPQNIGALIV